MIFVYLVNRLLTAEAGVIYSDIEV